MSLTYAHVRSVSPLHFCFNCGKGNQRVEGEEEARASNISRSEDAKVNNKQHALWGECGNTWG